MFNFKGEKDKKIDLLAQSNYELRNQLIELGEHIQSLEEEIDRLNSPDVARKTLGIIPIPKIDFVNVGQDATGIYIPKSYLPEDTESPEYMGKITELANISKSKVFTDMLDYLVNFQGNFTIRHGDTHEKTINGRFVIEGIELVRTMLFSARKKHEDNLIDINDAYDAHEVSISAESIADDLLNNN